MSLAVLADHMASKGRGPDSMLIHMSPSELQGLQALAMSHGGSLTINPETGLPEAGFLDKLLPAIIGFALNAVAPGAGEAVAGLWGGAGGAAAGTAAIVGGVQTARTGSLAEGVQAGLGAYGGANLASGIATAGVPGAIDSLAATAGAEAERQALSQGLSAEAAQAIRAQAIEEAGNQATAQSVSRADVISKGFDAASKNPMQFAKDNWRSLAGVAVPAILAGENVKSGMPQTVTKPGMIRPYSYDPYGGGYVAANPYEAQVKKAANGGIMGFDESSNAPVTERNINNMQNTGGMFNYAQDGGGVMKMAEGGLSSISRYALGGDVASSLEQAYAAGDYSKVNDIVSKNQVSQADIQNQWKGLDTSGLAGLGINLYTPPQAQEQTTLQANQIANINADAARLSAPTASQIAAQAATVSPYTNYSDATLSSFFANPTNAAALNTPGGLQALEAQYKADPAAIMKYLQNDKSLNLSAADIYQLGQSKGLAGVNTAISDWITKYPNATGAQISEAMKSAGMSQADINRYFSEKNSAYGTNAATGQAFTGAGDIYNIGQGKGFADITSNIKNWIATYPKATLADAQAAMSASGINELDVIRATGKTSAELYTQAKKVVATTGTDTGVTGGDTVGDHTGYHLENGVWVPNIDATQHTTTNVTKPTDLYTAPASSLPVGIAGNTGPSQIGGGATINPNGTVTTSPRIPGIPVGGFTGAENLRNSWTDRGGSLGYTSPTYTPEEFKTKYVDKLTGGSKSAYDYLTGKTPYSPKPVTATGEVMKPYAESVLGMPVNKSTKMYLFDPDTKQYKINPDYAIPTYDKDGKKSYNLTNADVKAFVDKNPSKDAFYTWATTNNLSPEQISAASGKSITDIGKLFSDAKVLTGEDGKIDPTKVAAQTAVDEQANFDYAAYLKANPDVQAELDAGKANFGTKADLAAAAWNHYLTYGKPEGRAYTKKAAEGGLAALTMARGGTTHPPFFSKTTGKFNLHPPQVYADGGMPDQFNLGGYSDGGRLLRGPGDGVSDSIPATIGNKRPARLADGEFVVPARIVSELGNGSTEAGARKLYAMMDRVQAARKGSIGKGKVANNSRSDKYLPA